MRKDIRKNLADGIHHYGNRYHVWWMGCYVAGFDRKIAAGNRLRALQGKPPIKEKGANPLKPKLKDGIHQSDKSGYWQVWLGGTWYGAYKFELSARQKYNSLVR